MNLGERVRDFDDGVGFGGLVGVLSERAAPPKSLIWSEAYLE